MSAQNAHGAALPPDTVLGNYLIRRVLGQGGFGITYEARHRISGEMVVLKENIPTFCACRDARTLQVMPTNPYDELREYDKYLDNFVTEAKLLARLNHPNIVKVQEAFNALKTAYYVMPWVGGQELHRVAPGADKIDETWLKPILRTLLDALGYLHQKKIYHRDVKPQNVLFSPSRGPVLIDFGTARMVISERSVTHVGTPGYAPIEQISHSGKIGPWTDFYALGATCYRLITGQVPPESNARLAADKDPFQLLQGRTALYSRFSPDFLKTVDKALSMRSEKRWQSAADWLKALPANDSTPAASTRFRPMATKLWGGMMSRTAAVVLFGVTVVGGCIYHAGELDAERQRLSRICLAELNIDCTGASLRSAASRNKDNIIRLLVGAGVDVNDRGSDGDTALHVAARLNNDESVEALLDAPGIDVNPSNDENKTPYRLADERGNSEAAFLILRAGGR